MKFILDECLSTCRRWVRYILTLQQQGRQRAEALAERSVEIAQAMVPLAGALARGGG